MENGTPTDVLMVGAGPTGLTPRGAFDKALRLFLEGGLRPESGPPVRR
ncbi:hypothetical protein [Azospirillum sp. A39]